jgi:hypothetical protein
VASASARGVAPAQPRVAAREPAGGDAAVVFDVVRAERYRRALAPVKWLLVAPHWLVLVPLGAGMVLVWVGARMSVLVGGRYPPHLFELIVALGRWGLRALAYQLLLTDEYPPFATDRDAVPSVRLDIAYPDAELARRPRAALAPLLVLPHAVVLLAAYACVLVALVPAAAAIVATGRYPRPLFAFAVRVLRMHVNVNAYVFCLVGRYPRLVP